MQSENLALNCALVPANQSRCGLWLATGAKSPVTGWGELMPVMPRPVDSLELPPPATWRDALLTPTLAMLAALQAAGGSVAVIGGDLLAELAVRSASVSGRDVVPDSSLAATIVATSSDARNGATQIATPGGSVIWLVAPWEATEPFDFYSDVHRKSLRLITRRWSRLPEELDTKLVARARDVVSDLTEEEVELGQWRKVETTDLERVVG